MKTTWLGEPKHAWIGLGALWIIGFTGALMRFIMAFFQVQIAGDLGISRSFISMAWSTNLLIAALCAPLGGWLVDRYGPRNVLLISAILGTAGTGTVVFGHHAAVFFLGYGILCGLAGMGSTATYMLIFGWFRHHRAKATGLLASASSLGLAISTPIFVSYGSLTWQDAFIASFALGLLVTLPTILLGIKGAGTGSGKPARESERLAEGKGQLDGERGQEALARRQRAWAWLRNTASRAPRRGRTAMPVVFIVVASALFTCGFNMGTVEMNLVAIHQLARVSPDMIAISMSVLGVMEITGSLIFGFLLDRIDKRGLLALLYGIRVAGFSLLYLHLGLSPVFFAIAFGFTYLSAIPGGLLIVAEHTGGQGKQTGWLLLFHQGGGILGSLVGGVSFDYFHNYQVLIGLDVLICLLVTLGYGYLFLTGKRKLRLAQNTEAAV